MIKEVILKDNLMTEHFGPSVMKQAGPFFTIPHTTPFLPSLARGFLAFIPTLEERAKATVYLPYARAAQAFRKCLAAESTRGSLLLPRIEHLQEIEGESESLEAETSDLRVIHPFERQSQLTHLIRRQQIEEAGRTHTEPPSWITAFHLSKALIHLLDQAAIEEIDLEAIHQLVPEEFAAHWQLTLDFLHVILKLWPQQCVSRKVLEPYPAYQQKIAQILAQWEKEPPPHWVIIAGSTGTMPTTVRLMEAIRHLPKGCIVLPGFRPSSSCAQLQPSHPQYGLTRLLKRMKIPSETVQEWPWCTRSDAPLEDWLEHTFQETIPSSVSVLPLAPLQKITAIPCDTLEEESLVIALLFRNVLETPGQHATLVTPNRTLTRYVQEHLKRWSLTVGDSSGTPLSETSLATLMLLMLDLLAPHSSSVVPLLALLKHPLTGLFLNAPLKLHWVYIFEREILRGLSPDSSFLSIEPFLFPSSPHKQMLQKGIQLLRQSFQSLSSLALQLHASPLSVWVEAHLTSVTSLMSTEAPWKTEGGYFLKKTLLDLAHKGQAFGALSLMEYRELLADIFKTYTFLETATSHPRLHILGTIEARLMSTDVMILSGLNEGSWPTEDPVDPWLSRSMRDTLGLPSPERRVGLMAHDFCQAFSAQQIILTRSLRVDGTPSLPSRFWLRLQTRLEAAGVILREDLSWRALAHQLQIPECLTPEKAPHFCPPLEARPQKLSVTQIETWRRDPYGLYARQILGLRPLKPLDQKLDAALFGTLVHKACESISDVNQLPTFEDVLEKGHMLFAPYLKNLTVQIFWWPRFEQIARWFVETEKRKRLQSPVQQIFTEVTGQLQIPHSRGIFTLTARADRLDWLQDGTFDLIDYKTGTLPRGYDIQKGFAPQLPLEAAILLQEGFFDQMTSPQLHQLSYWSLQGRDKNYISLLKGDPVQYATNALHDLKELIETFNDPNMPYLVQPFPFYAPSYNDYTHLERIGAWR